ncbi:MAG: hypothetical protein IT232_11535 [Flavobacteriales bacterium]|nr:hypothetical protein [Flavobacteriales bacterium]
MKNFYSILLFISLTLSGNLLSQSNFTDRTLRNCIVFADAYGYTKYFYPTKKTTQEDWEKIAILGLRSVYQCKTDEELIDSLKIFFSFIAPEIQFTKNDTLVDNTIEIKKRKFYYEHEGFGQGRITTSSKFKNLLIKLTQPYKTRLLHRQLKTIKKYYHVKYDNNISFYIPYGIDRIRKIKNIEANCKEQNYQNIGAIIIAWNIFKHFYPYQENINTDWYKILEASIKMVSIDTNEYKTFEALKYLSHSLNDGHAKVFYKKDSLYYFPSFTVKILDTNLYIREVLPELKNEIPTGVKIIRINNETPTKLIDSLKLFISSSTNQWMNIRIEEDILKGIKNSVFSVCYEYDQKIIERTVIRNKFSNWASYTGDNIKLLDDSIYYVNVEDLAYDTFKKHIAKFNNSKGVIIDFRGYPKSVNILKHFKDTVIQSPYWNVPHKTLFTLDKDLYTSRGAAVRWSISPSKKIITVPVVFLSDASSISFSETCLDMIKYYNLGTILGQPTAGSNGNVIGFTIFHKYKCLFTGMKVVNNDGRLITENGIEPDVFVPITEDGLKNSKDEILLFGIKYIKNK